MTRCAVGDAAATVRAVLARHRVQRGRLPDGFPADWLAPGVDVVRDDPALSPADLDAVGAVVTSCAVAIAETGTVVLDGGAGPWDAARCPWSRTCTSSSCVPTRSWPASRTPSRVLDPLRPLTWVSGPSATSDIELDRVEGVHGPRRLEVVVCR